MTSSTEMQPSCSPEPAGGKNQKHETAGDALRARVRGTNINGQTLLATDFLNHFNEIVMTLEMLPDMPELLEEAKAWQPKTYQDHFRGSVFTEKDLAIEAYRHAPAKYRRALETTIVQISRLIGIAVKRAETQLAANEIDAARTDILTACRLLQALMDHASAIINGSLSTMDQSEIDVLLET
ncbi:MAG: hypothetical protein QGI63_04055 [Rhodospirillales bacterium]|jgi:CO dehydrogenase/acetyl-CoA synthase gamma subunit (corrinoid Fe-S protein)|nr:hypothetical protein [Rhodospirillales bacterium]MDP6773423.1 hypothetical protein [Rhodospirillales bacterium]